VQIDLQIHRLAEVKTNFVQSTAEKIGSEFPVRGAGYYCEFQPVQLGHNHEDRHSGRAGVWEGMIDSQVFDLSRGGDFGTIFKYRI